LDETSALIVSEIRWVRRYALVLTKDAEAADDLVQDALERAVRKRHLWKGDGPIRAWLYRILYTVFINKRSANTRHGGDVGLEEGPQLWERPTQEDRVQCRDIAQAMRQLPQDQRDAIALTAFEELDQCEVAAMLDIPQGTLRSRLSRGREALRNMSSGTPSETFSVDRYRG